MAAGVGAFLLDVLFPRRCRWCGCVVGFAGGCSCVASSEAEGLRMPKGPVPGGKAATHGNVVELWACWVYAGAAQDALQRYKFQGQTWLAPVFAGDLLACYNEAGLAGRYDLIIPAPVSAATRRERGYNQSALLAKGLAKKVKLPCDENALRKTKSTLPQMTLNRQQRLRNLEGAFTADPRRVAGLNILLVDDIVTTGCTLNECAKTLLEAGANNCGALCVAATPAPTGRE